MRLDPSVRTSGDLIGPFRAAGIWFQVAKNGTKTLDLSGPALVIWEMSVDYSLRSPAPETGEVRLALTPLGWTR
jgi:hypothetical protein